MLKKDVEGLWSDRDTCHGVYICNLDTNVFILSPVLCARFAGNGENSCFVQ
jgi:hypothetical protein